MWTIKTDKITSRLVDFVEANEAEHRESDAF